MRFRYKSTFRKIVKVIEIKNTSTTRLTAAWTSPGRIASIVAKINWIYVNAIIKGKLFYGNQSKNIDELKLITKWRGPRAMRVSLIVNPDDEKVWSTIVFERIGEAKMVKEWGIGAIPLSAFQKSGCRKKLMIMT